MAADITFTIIKPKAFQNNHTGHILAKINDAGFKIIAIKLTHMSSGLAQKFYEVHKDRPFFPNLVEFMSSGPVIVAILQKENAVEDYRKLIGSTDPSKAELGTIRHDFGTSLTANAVHGSDSDENAEKESNFFFSISDRC